MGHVLVEIGNLNSSEQKKNKPGRLQNTGYPTAYPPMGSRPPAGAGAPPHLSTQYPPPSSYQPSSRPGGGGGGGGGGERQAPKRPWGQIGTGGLGYQGSRDKKAKKPPVPSVTCKICDVTVSSQQVYESHLAGKAHKKKVGLAIVSPLVNCQRPKTSQTE